MACQVSISSLKYKNNGKNLSILLIKSSNKIKLFRYSSVKCNTPYHTQRGNTNRKITTKKNGNKKNQFLPFHQRFMCIFLAHGNHCMFTSWHRFLSDCPIACHISWIHPRIIGALENN